MRCRVAGRDVGARLPAAGSDTAKDSTRGRDRRRAAPPHGKDKITHRHDREELDESGLPRRAHRRRGRGEGALARRMACRSKVSWLTPPQEDGQVQAQRIQQAVNDGADAILISCSDAGKVTGAINDAVDRGVPVMTFDSDAPQSKRFAYYGVDDIKTGQQTMAELAKLMNGKGKVAILAGNQNAPNLQHRVQGAKDEAAKHPGMTDHRHVQPHRDAAGRRGRSRARQQRVSGHPGLGDHRRLAAVHAVAAHRHGSDEDQDRVGRRAARRSSRTSSKGVVPVLLAQSVYLWGDIGVRTIVDKVHFKKDVPQIIPMELVRVTKDEPRTSGRKQLKAWGFTNVPTRSISKYVEPTRA